MRRMSPQITPRPFLKWVGGKGQLLPELMKRVAMARPFKRYHEPFVGGGALFFELYRQGALGRKQACLSDNNLSLIETYIAVRDHLDEIMELLQEHKARHDHDYYYAMRAGMPQTVPERAARIIYLNKTCYNGLYRVNSKGQFNVPIGDYKNPLICDEANLRAASEALKHARIEQRSFETVRAHAQAGDFVYFDPPYHPVSTTANFTAYDQGGFGEAEQRLLALVYAALAQNEVKVLLSNSYTPLIRQIYKPFTIDEVLATRLVNSRADRRGKVSEALVRSF
ncbi:MAG: DNA adenine methylase [Candidatus Hydrogenedentes bacterium]|nr:DNA adenine methylase [Candidatus Hydrogenedentota bacterium]